MDQIFLNFKNIPGEVGKHGTGAIKGLTFGNNSGSGPGSICKMAEMFLSLVIVGVFPLVSVVS